MRGPPQKLNIQTQRGQRQQPRASSSSTRFIGRSVPGSCAAPQRSGGGSAARRRRCAAGPCFAARRARAPTGLRIGGSGSAASQAVTATGLRAQPARDLRHAVRRSARRWPVRHAPSCALR
jgi:hypothetical protein